MNLLFDNKNELLDNIEKYYKNSEKINHEFGGPSTYFHVECIKEGKKDFLSFRHIELIYATLTSWGMHRMGNPEQTKAKMVNFDVFAQSIEKNKELLTELHNEKLESTNLEEIKDKLKTLFKNLEGSISKSKLVANSKIMHHLLWDLIPPMDRNFTIRFFYYPKDQFFSKSKNGKRKLKNISYKNEEEFGMFWAMLCEMKDIAKKERLKFKITDENFDTSIPKIIDNLIMAFVKDVKK